MTSNDRVRRLLRLQAVEKDAARQSQLAFAKAVAESAGAAARLSHIEGLILTSAPLGFAANGAGLAAAAQLRALLLPAAEMAEARLHAAVAEREEAEARLARVRARGRKLEDIVLLAMRAARAEAETREIDSRAPRRSARP